MDESTDCDVAGCPRVQELGNRIEAELSRKSANELRQLAKSLGLSGLGKIRKHELLERIKKCEPGLLQQLIIPTWWQKNHNHFWGATGVAIGVLGLVVSVAIAIFQSHQSRQELSASVGKTRRVPSDSIESPVRFSDFSAMNESERQVLFDLWKGKTITWEGYVCSIEGFEPGGLYGIPSGTNATIRIAAIDEDSNCLIAECRFGEIVPTDSGVELASRLYVLESGQRVRVRGVLQGTVGSPVLDDAWLEGMFPTDN